MNTNRKFAVSEGGKAVNTNRQAATIVASPRKIAIAAGVFYLITHVISVGALVL